MSRELIDSWFDAFRERDISKLRLAAHFVHSSPFGDIEGRDAYLALVEANAEAFFSPTLEIIDVIGSGSAFAVRYLIDGNPACDCIYVERDEISRIHSYYHYGKRPSF